ncbi:penicillin acylase family protein [Hoeflea sp. YIM 152468]|uniref:penicillin acylase family protein n=1 Tax=Hoeflea sp. YIM 152468 TaxID=3031759 RepID=UPI0023DABC4F|nr:penicillin acylase family protein [Hoeflea sp. YIM 152468]MDF1609518.1 penicillin acylase family protein [Hoeflea sp. YIM 152468]
MMRILKGLIKLILFLIPLAVMAAGAGMLWVSRSQAPVDGAMQIAGLAGEVTITRDRNGVPHIKARTRADVAAGLGFAHAQERLWQMEISRMAGQGRLSELFGEATVGSDIWLRTMGIYEAAEASLRVMDADTMAMLDGYARGVNAWMERTPQVFSARLPPEYLILGVKPEPWIAAHTLTAIKMMSISLAENLGEEALRLGFSRMGLSEAEIQDLLPYLDADIPPPMPDLTRLLGLDTTPLGEDPTTADASDVFAEDAFAGDVFAEDAFAAIDGMLATGASNNWVLSGARTASGLPVLANDPHLGLSAPSVWYLAHLEVTHEFDEPRHLIGPSLPGTPYVLLGRGNDIAWGFTNTATDAQDVFVERINPDNPDEYLTPTGWTQFGQAEEIIRVRGGENTVFTRRWTRHGPVFPAGYKKFDKLLPDNTVAALQWVALAHDDTTAMAGTRLFDMRTVDDFQAGFEAFLTPMQSMVVADTTGNIGFVAAGRVPLRDPANRLMGRAPAPGWNAIYDWRGYVPYKDLPRQTNPESGLIATANTKIVGPDYPVHLTFDWESSDRQNRIEALIDSAEGKHSAATSRQMQADVFSPVFARLKPRMLKALDRAVLSQSDLALVEQISAWDAGMARDRMEPLLFVAWVRQTMIKTFEDDLGMLFRDWFKIRSKVVERLLDGTTARNWCDDKATEAEESCEAIVTEAFAAAISDLTARYGEDASKWRWGQAHYAKGKHSPFGEVAALRRFFNVEVESGGGPFTLDRGRTQIQDDDDPYANTNAASYRGIFDMADLDRATYIQTTGQSGNLFSGHYSDFAPLWADVNSIEIPATDVSDPEGVWALSPGS